MSGPGGPEGPGGSDSPGSLGGSGGLGGSDSGGISGGGAACALVGRRFADPEVGLELLVPAGWEAVATASFPLALLAPEEGGFCANVGVTVTPLVPASVDGFRSYVERLRATRAATLADFQVVGERFGPHSGCPGWQMRATFVHEDHLLTQMTVLFATEAELLYELTATTLQRLEGQYLPVFRAVIDSASLWSSDR